MGSLPIKFGQQIHTSVADEMAKKAKTDAAPAAAATTPSTVTASSNAAPSSDSRNAFLKVFWDLAELNVETRVAAVDSIIAHLTQANDSDELSYTLKRLVRGLASSRDAARQGFSTALTALLHHFPSLSVESVLDLVLTTMDASNSMKGMEQREHMFGRLFGLLAIFKSGRMTHDDPQLAKLLDELIALSKWKKWFREACYEGLLTVVHALPPASFKSTVWPRIEPLLSGNVADFNADQVALAVGLRQYMVAHNLDKPKGILTTIVARHQFQHLVEPLKTSTTSYPRLHSAWRRLLDQFLTPKKLDEERFQEMWSVLVEGMLVAPSSTHERRGTALKLLEQVVGRVNSSTLRAILTPHVIKCLYNNAVSKKTYLHEAAIACLDTFASKAPLEFYRFLQHQFTHPLVHLVSHVLNEEDEEEEAERKRGKGFDALLAMDEAKEREEFQAKRIASARMWALDTMYTATLKLAPPSSDKEDSKTTDAVWTTTLSFFMQQAFFTPKKAVCEPAVSANVRVACVKRVYGLMGIGSHVLKDNQALDMTTSAPFRLWTCWNSMAKEWTLTTPLSKDHAAQRANVTKQLDSLQTELKSATEKKDQLRLKGFLLLYVCVGLQLLDAAQRDEVSSVLQDLEKCLAELNTATSAASPSSKKKKKSKATNGQKESQQQPLAVLTDMLLSMLAQESSVLRDVVSHVFRCIMEQLEASSIQSMVDVVVAPNDDDANVLEMSEEDDDDDGAPIDPTQLTNYEDDDENGDEEDDGGDDEKAEEIPISELQREDAALSALVGHVNEKKKAKQHAKRLRMAAIHFKVRVLDLLQAYAAAPSSRHALTMIEPLFQAWTSVKPHADQAVWSERMSAVLNKIARRKTDSPSVDAVAAVVALQAIVQVCTTTIIDKKQATVAAALVVYLVRVYLADSKSNTAAIQEVLAPAVLTLLTKKHAKLPRVVVDQLVQTAPVLASKLLLETLVAIAVEDKAADEFSRAETLRYLTMLFKAKGAVAATELAAHGASLHKALVANLGKVKGKRLKSVTGCALALLKARVDAQDDSLDAIAFAADVKTLDNGTSPAVKGMVSQMLQLVSGNKATDKKTSHSKRKRANSTASQ
ncbi:unnamed protein product [Aphanomyces euteiches]